MEIFKESLLGHPIIAQALSQYDFLHPDETTQTFESIISYLDNHLPNLRHASQISAKATAQVMASEAYITLEAENKKLKAANDNKRMERKGKGNGKGTIVRKATRTIPRISLSCIAMPMAHNRAICPANAN